MNIVLLGQPGAGKGTQAKVLSQEYTVVHISTGDMLREALKHRTEIGLSAKAYMDKGELVPDEIVIDMVKMRIGRDDARNGFLLDGFPRTEEQAIKLDEALAEMGTRIDLVLYFKTSAGVSIARLSGRRVCKTCGANFHVKNMPPKTDSVCDYCNGRLIQRDDDKEETVKRRLVVYEESTKALIDYYRQKGTLREVSGDLDVRDLFGDIQKLFATEGMT